MGVHTHSSQIHHSQMEVPIVEQCWFVKVAVLQNINAQEWHAELCEALGDIALLWWTVARWVQAFKSGRMSTAIMHHSEQFHVCSHKHIGHHNWTMHGWRQVLDCGGVSWTYKDFWVYSVLNFLAELKNVQVCCQAGGTLLSLRCWMLYVCNVQCDAQNAKCFIIIFALMRHPLKFWSSTYYYGHLIPAPES
jgi:hypothetical protein